MFDEPLLSTPEAKKALSVSQLTAQVRLLLEGEFRSVRVTGEVSNWTVAASGHAYFALKDEGALLSCVMWRSARARLRADIRDGLEVEASGRLSVYDKRGQYQLVAESLKPAGEGALWQKFVELKARLEAEGLFDESRKRSIPALPSCVGVVTSPTGAAIRDVLSVIHRRAPGLEVLVWPAKVQGDGAAREVEAGVRALSASGRCDVIIVGRGGGSLEDLWEFNDEGLARAIAECSVPVISAVGHETDFSISDFVADLRAPTPTAAAELVSADRLATVQRLHDLLGRADRVFDSRLRDARMRLQGALSSYALREPEARLREAQQRVDEAVRSLDEGLERRLSDARHRLEGRRAALLGHDPALILRKGYAVVRRVKDGKVVTTAARLKNGQAIRSEFADGEVRSVVTDDQPDLFDSL